MLEHITKIILNNFFDARIQLYMFKDFSGIQFRTAESRSIASLWRILPYWACRSIGVSRSGCFRSFPMGEIWMVHVPSAKVFHLRLCNTNV